MNRKSPRAAVAAFPLVIGLIAPFGFAQQGRAPSARRAAAALDERVWFDRPGDGALWARAANFKVKFDAEGTHYFPRFGPRAPRHFPVHMRVERVTVGEVAMPLVNETAALREGDNVWYDRGSLVELYELAPHSMEQKFVFAELPSAGELVVRLDIDSELSMSETSERFELHGEHGHVSYGRATVIDARGDSAPAPTSWVAGAMEIRVSADFLRTARFPITIDPLITTFTVDDGGEMTFEADVAYDRSNDVFCMVWEQEYNVTDHDVYCQLWNPDGTEVIGSLVMIDFTADYWSNPRVANNGRSDKFLVVAQESVAGQSPWVISSRLRHAYDNGVGLQTSISDDTVTSDKINPDVGGDLYGEDGSIYLVVWERVYNDTDHDIHGRKVSEQGTPFASTLFIDNSGLDDRDPDISNTNGPPPRSLQHWTVAWKREPVPSYGIFASQIRWDGTITQPTFNIVSTGFPVDDPSVSSLRAESMLGPGQAREYMVAYEIDTSNAHDIFASVYREDDEVVSAYPLSPSAPSDWVQNDPAVETDGQCFAVAYSETSQPTPEFNIYVSTVVLIAPNSLELAEYRETLAGSVGHIEANPRIAVVEPDASSATDPTTFFAVWEDTDLSFGLDRDVEGAFYDAACPTAYCTPPGGNSVSNEGASLSYFGGWFGDTVFLKLEGVPLQPGLLFYGPNQIDVPFGCGRRCVGGTTVRSDVIFPTANTFVYGWDTTGHSIPSALNFQYWYRDPANQSSCGSSFNLSNGLSFY